MRLREAIATMKPYVPGKAVEEVQQELGLLEPTKLNQNENPLGPSRRAVAAAAEALASIGHTYAEGTGQKFRSTLAQLWDLPGDSWVIAGNGSDEVFRLLAEAYLQPGVRTVVPAPSFSYYRFVSELMGATVETVPLNDATMDLEAMAAAAQGAAMVFLCRPNNPTGGVFPQEAFERFMSAVPSDCIVVLDEAYREFDDTVFDARGFVVRYPNLIVTRTFSKIYGIAGFRLGYGIAQPHLLKPFFTIRDPFSLNVAAQAAGIAALGDPDHLERSIALVREGKQYLYEVFARLGLSYVPTQGNFVLVHCGRPATEVYDGLLRQGIIVRPCASFGLPHSIRVTIGTAEQNRRLAEALEHLYRSC